MTGLTDEADSSTQMETCMKASGRTIRRMERVSILSAMAQVILVSGSRIFNMVLVSSVGLTDLHTKGTIASI
jgi:hypothetical protein